MRPLFSLLAPLVIQADGKYAFERRPRSSDWAVFRKYACRVYHISERISRAGMYSTSVFLEIATGRPLCHLFPLLRSLCIPYQAMAYSVPLLVHEGLANLTIEILTNPEHLDGQRSVVTYLPDRCPNLTRLDIRASSFIYTDIGLAAVLSALPHLIELHVTPQLLTQRAICNLALLPRLEHLNSTWEFPFEREGCTRSLFLLPYAQNGFTSLKTLALSQSFEDITSFLKLSKTKDLRRLSIDPDEWQSPEGYLHVLEAASTCCPNLETLSMVEWELREPEVISPQREPATWQLFRPLLRLSHLTSLAFMDLRMDVDALLNIAKALPSLRRLALRSTSRVDGPPLFPMSILPRLGLLCPLLELLCLYMDTSPPALGPISASTRDTPPLASLDELDVGPSSLDSPASEVVVYLSGILREDCRLNRLMDCYSDDGESKYKSWQPVIDFLPAITRVRKIEKDAAAAATSH